MQGRFSTFKGVETPFEYPQRFGVQMHEMRLIDKARKICLAFRVNTQHKLHLRSRMRKTFLR